MPLYEYQCPACGQRQEVLQKLGDDGSHLKCIACGHEGLRKLLSGGVVRVSGGGAAGTVGSSGTCRTNSGFA